MRTVTITHIKDPDNYMDRVRCRIDGGSCLGTSGYVGGERAADIINLIAQTVLGLGANVEVETIPVAQGELLHDQATNEPWANYSKKGPSR